MATTNDSAERAALRERIFSPPVGMEEQRVAINGHLISTVRIPAQGLERGQVILLTGFNESFHDHYETIKEMTEHGLTVYTFDWAGQGTSERKITQRHNAPPTDGLLDDVRDLNAIIRDQWQIDFNRPTIIFGYSMGGHVGSLWQSQNPNLTNQLAGSVWPGLMADLRTPFNVNHDVSRSVSGFMSRFGFRDASLPNWRGSGLRVTGSFNHAAQTSNDFFTRHHESDRSRLSTEARSLRTAFNMPSWGWVRAAYDTLDQTASPEFWQNINTPTLILTGTHDEVVSIQANRSAAQSLPDGQHVSLEGANHSLWSLNDTLYRSMFSHIHSFMDDRISAFNHDHPQIPAPANDRELVPLAPSRVA